MYIYIYCIASIKNPSNKFRTRCTSSKTAESDPSYKLRTSYVRCFCACTRGCATICRTRPSHKPRTSDFTRLLRLCKGLSAQAIAQALRTSPRTRPSHKQGRTRRTSFAHF